MPASRSAHKVICLLLTVTPRGRFCLKDPTSQMRTRRLRGSESSHRTQGQDAVVPGPDSATSQEQLFCLFHSTREHTLWAPAYTCLCLCTHSHENVHAPIAMQVCVCAQAHMCTPPIQVCTQQAGSDTEAQRHMCVQCTHTSMHIWMRI